MKIIFVVLISFFSFQSFSQACVNLTGTYKALDSSWGDYNVKFTETNCQMVTGVWTTSNGSATGNIVTDGNWVKASDDAGYYLKMAQLTDQDMIINYEYHQFGKVWTDKTIFHLETIGNIAITETGVDENGNVEPPSIVHLLKIN